MGAVSSTTKPCSPSATVRANALNTAISSVQASAESSSKQRHPLRVQFGRRFRQRRLPCIAGFRWRIDPAHRQVRDDPPTVAAR